MMKWFKRIVSAACVLAGVILLVVAGTNVWFNFKAKKIMNTPEPGNPSITRVQAEEARLAVVPSGKNLLDSPLWKEYLSESTPYAEPGESVSTNAISKWYAEDRCSICRQDLQTLIEDIEKAQAKSAKTNQSISKKEKSEQSKTPRPGRIDSYDGQVYLDWKKLSSLMDVLNNLPQGKIKSEEDMRDHFKEFDPNVVDKLLGKSSSWEEYIKKFMPLFSFMKQFEQTVAATSEFQALRPDQQSAALFIAFIMEGDANWEQIKNSLAQSDYVQYKPTKAEYNLFSPIQSSFFSIRKKIVQESIYRAEIHARLGDRDATVSDLECGLNLLKLQTVYPTLISELVDIASHEIVARGLHNILLEKILTAEDCARIQSQWEAYNPIAGFFHALEGEDYFIRGQNSGQDPLDSFWLYWMGEDPVYPSIEIPSKIFYPLMKFSLGGVVSLNFANNSQMVWKMKDCLAVEQQTVDIPQYVKAPGGYGKWTGLFVKMEGDAFVSALAKCLQSMSHRDCVILACALERYRLKNNSYPEKLEMLMPEYLKAMPVGWAQGEHAYSVTEEGYELKLNKYSNFKKSNSSNDFSLMDDPNKDISITWRMRK